MLIPTHLLCGDVVSVDEQADAAVLGDAGLVNDGSDVVPQTLVCQFRAAETHRVVTDHRLICTITAVHYYTNNNNNHHCQQQQQQPPPLSTLSPYLLSRTVTKATITTTTCAHLK